MKPDLKIVEAPVESARDVEVLMQRMRKAGLVDVMVLGYDKDGDLWTDVNFVDGPTAIWLLEKAKHKILQGTR